MVSAWTNIDIEHALIRDMYATRACSAARQWRASPSGPQALSTLVPPIVMDIDLD